MARAAKENTTTLPRRDLLMKAMVAAPALAAARAAVPFNPVTHSDVQLLAAWEGFKRWWHIIAALPPDTEDHIREGFFVKQDHFRSMVESLPVTTRDGVVVKLSYLFLMANFSRHAEEILFLDRPYDASVHENYHDRVLWNLLTDVKKMGVAA